MWRSWRLGAWAVGGLVVVLVGRAAFCEAPSGKARPPAGEACWAADAFLGDWQGQWSKAGEGAARAIVAQVIPRGGGKYLVNLLPEFDKRCQPHAQVEATASGGVLRFDKAGWTGQARGDVLSGTGPRGGKQASFSMKKVVRLSPRLGARPPKGAVVLFDGKGFDHWEPRGRDRKIPWKLLGEKTRIWPPLEKHAFGTAIRTRRAFGDFQMHLEFRLPLLADVTGQTRANSGIIIEEFEFYEIQILDSYGLAGRKDDCGAIYGKAAPKVNMCAPPHQWQSYDITYRGPRVDAAGKLTAKTRITIDHNGKLIHKDLELPYSERALRSRRQRRGRRQPGRITLQHHGDPVEFRNIWIQPLDDARAAEAPAAPRP